MSISWNDDEVTLPWINAGKNGQNKDWSRNWPIVEVMINGTTLRMVPDTGAMTTYFFADSAKKAGIELYSDDAIIMASSNNKTAKGGYAVVPLMDAGGLEVRNTLSMVSDRPFLFPKTVDGLIGWPVLSQLVMELDAKEQTITFRSSYDEEPEIENFFWISDPAVYLLGGIPRRQLLFYLDTGATHSFFNDSGLEKTNADIVRNTRSWTFGIGGAQHQKSNVVNINSLFLDGYAIRYNEYANKPIRIPYLQGAAGVLGCDIAQAGRIRFNFPKGRISFEPYNDMNYAN